MNECKGCKHFFPPDTIDPSRDNRGECMRFPRQGMMKADGMVLWVFPMMNPDDGCGEWKK